MQYGSESWCLNESEMKILRGTVGFMVSAMCVVLLKVRKRSSDLMLIFGLNEAIDQLAMANCVNWYGHVLRRALDFVVEGQGGREKSRS